MFRFKQFSVKQDKTAMKVGTDGVLLGSWTPIDNNPYSVLDVGTGTGLVALMLAQRSFAQQIDALEIEDNAYEQAVDNFEESPWNDRLFCYHAGFDEFVQEIDEEYDLIVSNPPFFESNHQIQNQARESARFYDILPFDKLIEGASKLLSSRGVFSIIIPFDQEERFIIIASEFSLFPFKITHVKGTATSKIKRSLIAFSTEKKELVTDTLILEIERHHYTPEFKELVKDFYIKL